MTRPGRPTLLVFARAPAIGRGKTRLARDVGRVEAWRLYRAMSAELIRRLGRDPRWRTVVRITPDRALWPGAASEPQGRGGLTPRLERALRAHARGPVAVIGTDSPEIARGHVARAFRAARRTGVALGPAEDGGFWLLALGPVQARRVELRNIRWSSAYALADSVAALGGRTELLETIADIDDGHSLAALQARRRRPVQPGVHDAGAGGHRVQGG
jgi:glycosyltransferase A (GT-A) superfamily protein (DUF2064 family)